MLVKGITTSGAENLNNPVQNEIKTEKKEEEIFKPKKEIVTPKKPSVSRFSSNSIYNQIQQTLIQDNDTISVINQIKQTFNQDNSKHYTIGDTYIDQSTNVESHDTYIDQSNNNCGNTTVYNDSHDTYIDQRTSVDSHDAHFTVNLFGNVIFNPPAQPEAQAQPQLNPDEVCMFDYLKNDDFVELKGYLEAIDHEERFGGNTPPWFCDNVEGFVWNPNNYEAWLQDGNVKSIGNLDEIKNYIPLTGSFNPNGSYEALMYNADDDKIQESVLLLENTADGKVPIAIFYGDVVDGNPEALITLKQVGENYYAEQITVTDWIVPCENEQETQEENYGDKELILWGNTTTWENYYADFT